MLILMISLPLISINMEQKKVQDMWFAQPLSFVADSFQSFFSSISLGVRGTTAEYVNLINIKKENARLKHEMDEIKTRLQLFTNTQNEVERLRNVLDFKQNTKMQLIPAQVIGRDLLADHKTITINKGTNHGLKHLQAVLTVSGAVGYIFKPNANTSHVMLITDRYSVVDALIQKTRAHGIIEGTGKDSGILQYIDRTEDVQVGDLIVTGGLDNVFPKGFPLAVVANVARKTKSASLIVEVKPVIESNKIEEVFIVANAANENFLPEIATKDTSTSATATVKKND
ncbi:MAG: rod shape-determining protein MreC [Pseudobdellovibrio sp.]